MRPPIAHRDLRFEYKGFICKCFFRRARMAIVDDGFMKLMVNVDVFNVTMKFRPRLDARNCPRRGYVLHDKSSSTGEIARSGYWVCPFGASRTSFATDAICWWRFCKYHEGESIVKTVDTHS